MSANVTELAEFIGRFHPVLVHLPIGFIMLVAMLESLAVLPRFKQASSANRTILVLTVPATFASAGCGWLLSWSKEYDPELLAWHKWTGTGLVAAAVVLLVLHGRGWRRAYRVFLFASVVALVVTSHWGGSLTHGSDYLTRFAPGALRSLLGGNGAAGGPAPGPAADPITGPVYAAVIQPIFNAHCIACHGPGKSKAGLRLDTVENALKGSESGPVIVPGSTARSLLVKRVLLPYGDEDHMPPEGRHQPLYDDLVLLQWWIEAGAPTDKSAEGLNPPEHILRILETRGAGLAEGKAAADAPSPRR